MKESMFTKEGTWYKGNLHSHSTVSDGKATPEERAKAYREHGYSFLALTDHNVFASYPELCTDDFLMIPATERDALNHNIPCGCVHLVGLSEKPVPEKVTRNFPTYQKDRTKKDWQELVEEMKEAGEIPILAHPVWSRMCAQDMIKLDGYIGIEVFNTTCQHLNCTGKADYLIDCCLRAGKKAYLFAEDDCHEVGHPDVFGGWIMVKANELTHEEIIRQIKAGNFYASTGPEIYDFGLDGDTVYVECSPCESINFIAYEQYGHSIVKSGITSGTFKLTEGLTYVRCECIDAHGNSAYTNPIYLK